MLIDRQISQTFYEINCIMNGIEWRFFFLPFFRSLFAECIRCNFFFLLVKSNCHQGNKFSFYKQMKYIFIPLKMQWKEKPFHNTNLDLNKIISASYLYSAGTVLGWSFTFLFFFSSPLYSCCKRKSDFFRFFSSYFFFALYAKDYNLISESEGKGTG